MSERTVLVRLKLAIQEYVRDARLAGREGSAAFDKTSVAAESAGRNVNVLEKNTKKLGATSVGTGRDVDRMHVSLTRADHTLDRFSGRLKIIIRSALMLGPALAPITTALVPALTGIATGLGFAAASAGTAVFALQGVGDALDAIEKARLEPTVDNLEAAALAVEKLGPDGAAFVKTLNDARPALQALQMSARAGLLPGLGDSIDTILSRGDQVSRILFEIGDATGDLFSKASDALASGDFNAFFNFIETEARPQLMKLGETLGYVAKAGTDVFMALDPLTDSFGDGLLKGAEKLAFAASKMEQSQGVRDFISYVQATGPQVVDTFFALAEAVLKIGEAAAPLGGPILETVEGFANAVSAIADSPVGTPLVTLAVGYSTLVTAVELVDRLNGSLAKTGGKLGLTGVAARGVSTPVIGLGVAVGAAIVFMDRLGKASSGYKADAMGLTETLNQQTGAVTSNTREFVANDLAKQGVFDSAKALGIGLDTVTDAALGNKTAIAEMNAQIQAASNGFYDAQGRTVVGAETLGDYRQNVLTVTDAVGQNNHALDEGSAAAKDHAEAMGTNADQTSKASREIERFNRALTRSNNLLDKRSGLRDFQQAIDDASESVKENGKTLDINTRKGRENQAALDGIARSALDVVDKLKGTDRQRMLTTARRNLIDTAREMGATRQQARRLADQLLDMDGLTVNTNVITTYRKRGVGAPLEKAAGGEIRGPGTGTSDSIPALLSNGEHVINARAAQNNRTLLHNINTHGATKRFAGGGRVGGDIRGAIVDAGGTSASLDRLGLSADQAAKALDRETTRRDKLLDKRNTTASAVTSAFRSDIFATNGDVWRDQSSANPMDALRADIANAKAFQRAVTMLRKKGFGGAALQDIVNRGDLGLAQQYASQSSSELGDLESLYNARQRITSDVGMSAGNAVLGDQLQELRRLNTKIDALERAVKQGAKETGDAVGNKINGAVAKGTRDRKR